MKKGRFLLLFLLCFACAFPGVKRYKGESQLASRGQVKGLRPIRIIGEKKLGSSSLYLPTGIALDLFGNLFIADTGNDRVVKCDPEGRFLGETGGFGWEPGEFNRPTYIATDNGLNVYVVDAQNRRIQRLDRNLNFLSVIEIKGEEELFGFGLPEGIALTSSGEILISDIEADHIIKLNNFFEYERTFGGFGNIQGGLRDPRGIFFAQDGDLYVADSGNDRVAVFDVFGNFLKSFGEKTLKNPSAVAVGQDQMVYVANTGKNSLTIFDRDGNLILEYPGSPSETFDLSRPTDLKLGGEDELFVVDSGKGRILVFQLLR